MSNPTASDVKPFIGAYDFEGSRDFYIALGWRLNWDREDIAELELGGCRFYLQRYYNAEWCNNTMLHVTVEDARAWYEHARGVIDNNTFAGAPGGGRVAEPKHEDYGALVTYVWDPSGVLLHFAQPVGPSE